MQGLIQGYIFSPIESLECGIHCRLTQLMRHQYVPLKPFLSWKAWTLFLLLNNNLFLTQILQ